MAKKKLKPLEDPPKASSSDEDEVEALSGDDEKEQISDDSSSDAEDDLMNPVNISYAKNTKSEKPITVTKPKANDIGGSLAVKKRPIEMTSVNAKRAKIAEETKKPSFQRLWSEEDEISMLQGMIDFKADTGKSPYEDMDSFYELTSKSISFEASKIQFVDKIRSLKRKYMGKVKQGVDSFSKAHDIECLKLSKYIWGSHGMALNSNVKKTEKKLGKEVVEEDELVTETKSISVEGNGNKVEEDREVLVNGDNGGKDRDVLAGGDNGEEGREVLANGDNGGKYREVLAGGETVEEDREVLVNGDNGGKDREVLAGGDNVEEDREVLANDNKVDEDKEVFINGGGASKPYGVRASDWFEDSFLVGSIAGLGVSEQFVKQKWSMVTVETKKRMEEKWKLLQAKEMELLLHKTDFMSEIASVIAEAS